MLHHRNFGAADRANEDQGPPFVTQGDPAGTPPLQAAADALRANLPDIAFGWADRASRKSRGTDPVALTLRGLALEALGRTENAANSLRDALKLSPRYLPAARALFKLSSGDRDVCQKLFRHDRLSYDLFAPLAPLLNDPGQPHVDVRQTIASIVVRLGLAEETQFDIRFTDQIEGAPKEKNRNPCISNRHLHSNGLRIVECVFVQPDHKCQLEIIFENSGNDGASFTYSAGSSPAPVLENSLPARAVDNTLNVIIPLYSDAVSATRCIDSVLDQNVDDLSLRIILIDDASPEPEMRTLIENYSTHSKCEIIKNRLNLGFAGAVNRGLAACPDGDVLILNSDTIVPRHALQRFRLVAKSHSNVGTLTPLSNNGLYTSFPTPFEVSKVPNTSELEYISDTAWSVNGDSVVDIPSGIGFALYVKHSVREKCGYLRTHFGRGYYEDIDFCLRAAEHGWMNVCATGIFVAHEGSLSFGSEKTALVSENNRSFVRLYPNYSKQSSYFTSQDPIQPYRARIEARLTAPQKPGRLLIGRDTVSIAKCEDMAASNAASGERVYVASIRTTPEQDFLEIRAADEGVPAQMKAIWDRGFLAPTDPGMQGTALKDVLERLHIGRATICDPAGTPLSLLSSLRSLGMAIDVEPVDAGLICPRRHLVTDQGRLCAIPTDPAICDRCIDAAGAATSDALSSGVRQWRQTWHQFREASASAPEYVAAQFRHRSEPAPNPTRQTPTTSRRARIGMWPLLTAVSEQDLLGSLCSRLRSALDCDIVIFGSTPDDSQFLDAPHLFVTGPVEPDEVPLVLDDYAITHSLVATRRAILSSPILDRLIESPIPLARIAPPSIQLARDAGDITLDGTADDFSLANAVVSWLQGSDVV